MLLYIYVLSGWVGGLMYWMGLGITQGLDSSVVRVVKYIGNGLKGYGVEWLDWLPPC